MTTAYREIDIKCAVLYIYALLCASFHGIFHAGCAYLRLSPWDQESGYKKVYIHIYRAYKYNSTCTMIPKRERSRFLYGLLSTYKAAWSGASFYPTSLDQSKTHV